MDEHERGNSEQGDGAIEEIGDDFVPEDSLPVCPKCLTPCHPLQNYCGNCDSNEAINPLASYMPFVRIRFVYGTFGKMWRKIWYDKDTSVINRLFCLFMIIVFAPVFLVLGLPFFLTVKIKPPFLQNVVTIILYIIALILLMALVSFSKF